MKQKLREPRVKHTQRFNFNTFKKIEREAEKAKRSISAEVELRIERTFRQDEEQEGQAA